MQTKILPATDASLALAAAALARGELVAMPTETVYGLAGVAFDEAALARIFAAKERPTFDPLICHVPVLPSGRDDWPSWLAEQGLLKLDVLSPVARERLQKLAAKFWPGPLTLVLPKQECVPDLATSGLPSVGVRCPRHPVAQRLLRTVGKPLAAPSANRFGRISPTNAQHVLAELEGRIPLILDGGPCEIGIESTVLLIEPSGELLLLRPGAVSASEIASVANVRVGVVNWADKNVCPTEENAAQATPLPAPGLLVSHYAPSKPLELLSHPADENWLQSLSSPSKVGLLLATGDPQVWRVRRSDLVVASLSVSGDEHEAARNLFALLRELDADPRVARIVAEPAPGDSGLAFAINDRLTKASAPRRAATIVTS